MSGVKRWSESESEVDPVLRAVMRHAKAHEVPPAEMSALVARLEARLAEESSRPDSEQEPRTSSVRRLRRSRPRWASTMLRAGLLVASGGVAWAAWQRYVEPPRAELATPQMTESEENASRATGRARGTSQVSAQGPQAPSDRSIERQSESPDEREAKPSRAFEVASAPSARSAEVAGAQDDAAALQRARQRLGQEPVAALADLREHARTHPKSPLSEERDALVIDALVRLGRRAEAKASLAEFSERFPRSPYRRRLSASLEGTP